MFSQLASFNLIKDGDDSLLDAGGKSSKGCVFVVSEKYRVYYMTYSKNAKAFYYSFKSMFRGMPQTYGSQRLRDLINESDFEDWLFFYGKAADIPYFKDMQGLRHYEELLNYKAPPSQSAVIKCNIWTVRENETGMIRVIFSALPIDTREVLYRFKRSLLALQRFQKEEVSPRLKDFIHRAYQNALDATIVENYDGFTISSHTTPIEFSAISSISRSTNEGYFKPWAQLRG